MPLKQPKKKKFYFAKTIINRTAWQEWRVDFINFGEILQFFLLASDVVRESLDDFFHYHVFYVEDKNCFVMNWVAVMRYLTALFVCLVFVWDCVWIYWVNMTSKFAQFFIEPKSKWTPLTLSKLQTLKNNRSENLFKFLSFSSFHTKIETSKTHSIANFIMWRHRTYTCHIECVLLILSLYSRLIWLKTAILCSLI